jgi:hypothetical protein
MAHQRLMPVLPDTLRLVTPYVCSTQEGAKSLSHPLIYNIFS